MARIVIDDSNWADRARFRCPKGHNWWEAYDSTWYCRSCRQSYEELIDAKTGHTVNRSDVILTDGLRKR